MNNKYWTGEVSFCFKGLSAEEYDELYEKIESQLPSWAELTRVDIDYFESEREYKKNYDPN